MTRMRRVFSALLRRRPAGPAPRGPWPDRAPVDPDALAQEFTAEFGHPPEGVWHAPGQAVLLGEHTEPGQGTALPLALPWGVSAALARTEDGTVRVSSPLFPGEPACFPTADPGSAAPWARGPGRAAARLGPGAGLRVRLDADLPADAPLGWSAAALCALLRALDDLCGPGSPPARADLLTALNARSGHALFLDYRTLRSRAVPFDLAGAGLCLVVVDPRVDRSGGPEREHRARVGAAQRELGPLREVADLPAALRRLGDPARRARVQHVVTEVHRVNAAVGLMRAGRPAEVGALLTASHLSARSAGLPTPEADLAVEAAVGAGARGARMAGYAGAVLALAARERVEAVEAAVLARFTERGWAAPQVRTALPAPGARRVR